ncbi:MAG: class I SAM-dependent methyltransferase [Burkholderiales bacterium]|jgi:SAM-dependent methyltransferase|nr:class I SAM-dependent methyltransferase [Burkholderiales bacterium]
MTLPLNAHGLGEPSVWVLNCLDGLSDEHTARGGVMPKALDLACGGGRHSRALLAAGYEVLAVDKDTTALAQCPEGAQTQMLDLEGSVWPLSDCRFDLVLVTHYLWRPHFLALLDCVAPGGYLLYETFMVGNEAFGSPKNPAFLLRSEELLDLCRPGFEVLRFEQGVRKNPGPALVQRILAQRKPSLAIQSAHVVSARNGKEKS